MYIILCFDSVKHDGIEHLQLEMSVFLRVVWLIPLSSTLEDWFSTLSVSLTLVSSSSTSIIVISLPHDFLVLNISGFLKWFPSLLIPWGLFFSLHSSRCSLVDILYYVNYHSLITIRSNQHSCTVVKQLLLVQLKTTRDIVIKTYLCKSYVQRKVQHNEYSKINY